MPRNVVLLVLDCVRKDYFDECMPRLERRSDTSFEQCRAPSSWSIPSHASFLTGELPSQHGVHAYNQDFGDLRSQETFLGDLGNHTSIAVSSNHFAGPRFGFDSLFDEFVSVPIHSRFSDVVDVNSFLRQRDVEGEASYLNYLKKALAHQRPVKSLLNGIAFKLGDATEGRPIPRPFDYGTKALCSELRRQLSNADAPVFLFANLMEAHEPYEFSVAYPDSLLSAPTAWSSKEIDQFELNNADQSALYKDYLENYRRCYRASLEYLDRNVASLLDDIADLDGNTTVIVTADHGQNLGLSEDDHLIGHVGSLSEGLLHVPLEMVNPPSGFPDQIGDLTTLLDLPTLITGIANGETPSISREVVTAERIGQPLGKPENFEFWNRMLRCAYRDNVKYCWDSLGTKEEYGLGGESEFRSKHVDGSAIIPTWASEPFGDTIEEYLAEVGGNKTSAGDSSDLDNATRVRLQDHGYL